MNLISRKINKSGVLYESLREKLKTYGLGERFLTIRAIMQQYKVSQVIVDRAVEQLIQESLLRKESNRGGFLVTSPVVEASHQRLSPGIGGIILAIPRWPSTVLEEMKSEAIRLNSAGQVSLHVVSFESHLIVPRGLERYLSGDSGLLVMLGDSLDLEGQKQLLAYRSICPTVVFGHYYDGLGVGSVGLDDNAAGALAAHHLYLHGHRHIAVLISEPLNRVILNRVRAIELYASLQGMTVVRIDAKVKHGDNGLVMTYDCFSQVIEHGFDFTGLIGIAGESLMGAINACRNHDVQIPQDLSVVAIDGENLTRACCPPIDTIACDSAGQLDDAIGLLDELRLHLDRTPFHDLFRKPKVLQRASVARLSSESRP